VDERLAWEEQVDRTIDTYLGILASDPVMTITFAVELASLGTAGQELRRRALERYAELVIALARSYAMRRDRVREISRPTAIMLVAGINELVNLAVARGEPLGDLAPDIKAMLKAVLAPAKS
jgi:hypothetical protein